MAAHGRRLPLLRERLPYDLLVLATGAKAVKLGLPGEDREGVFTLHNLTDAMAMKTFLEKKRCRKAVIVGAGYIGLEMTEAFGERGMETTLIHNHPLPQPIEKWGGDPEFAELVLGEIAQHHVTFLPETKPLAIEQGKESWLRVITDRGEIDTDIVLLSVGTRPNTDLASSLGLEMGVAGAIKVDFHQRTSRPEVYAVGDCCEVFHRVLGEWRYVPLGDVANKQGRTAGQHIAGIDATFPGVVGAQGFKFFQLEIAATGLTEEEARRQGLEPVSVIVQGLPVGRPMARGEKLVLKLIAQKRSRKLLGAQAIAHKGAVSRINSLSIALWAGMTIDEIGYLDLAYAPPFGGAWDPIHVAAQALGRKL